MLANPLLMEVTGAKVLRTQDGRQVILGVASTPLKDLSAKERLRAEKICRIKALASVVAEREGVQVGRIEKLEERTTVHLDGEKETANRVSELLQLTKTRVEGIAKEMPVVGRWKSKDGDVLFLAIGVICDREGNAIREGLSEKKN